MATMSERLLPIPELTVFDLARFWGFIKQTESCWIWTGALQGGYGNFSLHGRNYRATRVVYKIAYKEPGGLLVCHECNNPSCVNPKHLFLGTQFDNQQHCSDSNRYKREGDLNSNSQLAESEVLSILKAIDAGESRAGLSRKHHVSLSLIHRIARRETWGHLQYDRASKSVP
jgi:hypothetical protein